MAKMKKWTTEDVLTAIVQSFPDEDPQLILSILSEYKNNEPERVQMAILKISEGNLDQLLTYVSAACLDYRDVLMWSEM